MKVSTVTTHFFSAKEPLTCPYCGGTVWRGGPEGGAWARDILCERCHREYLISPFGLMELEAEGPKRLETIYGVYAE